MKTRWRQIGLAGVVSALCSQLAFASENVHLDSLNALLAADWSEPDSDWVDDLLVHVDGNLDPSLPLVDGGWTAALRHLAYDCWTKDVGPDGKPTLRNYDGCGPSAGQIHLRMHDVLWVLVRHEWAAYSSSVGNQDAKASAWTLEQAMSEYQSLVTGAEPRSVEPFSITLQRLRVMRGFVDELSRLDDGEYLTDLERRQIVRDEINRQLALDGSGGSSGLKFDPYLSIVVELQTLTRDIMQAYLSGAEAEQDAKSLAALVYGNGTGAADQLGKNLESYLTKTEAGSSDLGEREALSLASLKDDAKFSRLYAFVRDALTQRPNAIGISERYARMKQRLTNGVPDLAQELSAEKIRLAWPEDLLHDPPEKAGLSLMQLWFGDSVITVERENDGDTSVGLDEACQRRSASENPPSGRCAFKALADRALRAKDGDNDLFEINAREEQMVLLLAEIRKSDRAKKIPGLVPLVDHLIDQTGATFQDAEMTAIEGHVFALPYEARPNWFAEAPKAGQTTPPLAVSDFDLRVCWRNFVGVGHPLELAPDERAVFWANHCKIDPEAFDGENRLPELLYARLDRLLLGKPIANFKAKIGGLKLSLAKIDGELIEEDTLASLGDDTPDLAKDGTFIRRVCDQSIAMLPALAAVGLREVSLPTDRPSDEGLDICR